jgi:hypothetical protein
VFVLQLCIHRTRIAQQRKKITAAMNFSKTIKRQAFNKDRNQRLTATTKPNGRRSTSLIDFSLPPRTPPRAASDKVFSSSSTAADSSAEQAVVDVGSQVADLTCGVLSEQTGEGLDVDDSASDGSVECATPRSAGQRVSGEDSDDAEQDCESSPVLNPAVIQNSAHDVPSDDASLASAATHINHDDDSHLLGAAAVVGSAASTVAGEGWDDLVPFGDVDVGGAVTKDGSMVGEGRIAQLPLDGLLFYDVPM